MKIMWLIIVFIAAFAIGAFGWPQIVGSLRIRQRRFLLPVVIWLVILAGLFFLVRALLPEQIYAYLIGSGIALVMTLFTKRIE